MQASAIFDKIFHGKPLVYGDSFAFSITGTCSMRSSQIFAYHPSGNALGPVCLPVCLGSLDLHCAPPRPYLTQSVYAISGDYC